MKQAAALVTALVLVALIGANGARADEPTAAQKGEASRRFAQGLKFYDKEDWASALAEFEAARQAVPAWQVLLNVGLCERQLKRYGEAVRHLHAYLDEGGARITAEQRARVERELREIGSLVGEVEVRIEAPAGETPTLDVDGQAREAGAPVTLLLNPGPHALTGSCAGCDPDRREVRILSQQHVAVVLRPRLRATTATLEVASHPPGAELFVDGKSVGTAPFRGELAAGGHELRGALAGYEKGRAEVVLIAGQPRQITLELSPLSAAERAAATPWYRRWYVWTPIAIVVAGGAAAGGYFGWQAGQPPPPTYEFSCCMLR